MVGARDMFVVQKLTLSCSFSCDPIHYSCEFEHCCAAEGFLKPEKQHESVAKFIILAIMLLKSELDVQQANLKSGNP
jgi:hypothetical protein